MTLRESERREALLALEDDVAAGLVTCEECGKETAIAVTQFGILGRECYVDLIGPLEEEGDDDE